MDNQVSMMEAEETQEYRDFVEKFKPKKTTDDCYTPGYIYDAVSMWVEKEYGVDRDKFVRPFWPGGDYERFVYPLGCVVVDNPPFSILSKIVLFYQERGIPFFLFAPYVACVYYTRIDGVCLVCINEQIVYENGANVGTAFITNLDTCVARTAPSLNLAIRESVQKHQNETKKEKPKYVYPQHVLTFSQLSYMSKHGIDFRVERCHAVTIRKLDAQKQYGKVIYGCALLLSEKAAAEKAAAEKEAAEKEAAEKAAVTKWELSEREWEIVRSMGT